MTELRTGSGGYVIWPLSVFVTEHWRSVVNVPLYKSKGDEPQTFTRCHSYMKYLKSGSPSVAESTT